MNVQVLLQLSSRLDQVNSVCLNVGVLLALPTLCAGGPYGPPEVCNAAGACTRTPSPSVLAQRFPSFCPASMRRYTEQLERGKQLAPRDIFYAQLAARAKRLRRQLAG